MLPYEFPILEIPVNVLDLQPRTDCAGKGGRGRKTKDKSASPFSLCSAGGQLWKRQCPVDRARGGTGETHTPKEFPESTLSPTAVAALGHRFHQHTAKARMKGRPGG